MRGIEGRREGAEKEKGITGGGKVREGWKEGENGRERMEEGMTEGGKSGREGRRKGEEKEGKCK